MKTFVLNEDHEMLRTLAHDLALAEIRPRSEAVDHGPNLPREGVQILAEAGLSCCMVPEAYGGAGLDWLSQVCVLEEMAKECASTAWALANTAAAAECVQHHGGEALCTAVLPALAGGALAAVGEAAEAALTVRDGLLSGRVAHVPGAGACGWYVLPVREEGDLGWYLLKGDCSGLRCEAGRPMLGLKGFAMGTLVLEACPAEALESGVSTTLAAVLPLGMAAVACGLAQGALNEAIAYVNQRVQFGRTIAQFENTQQIMAELLAEAEAARALTWDAARVLDAGEDAAYASALAKLTASDAAAVVTRKCVQFMGGYGYSREYPVERKMRDAKMTELCGRSSEALRARIAEIAVVR